jgi:hypothetical protein
MFEHNRLIGASGKEVPTERTLTYFLTHEITHSLGAVALGRPGYWKLNEWKREGYADVAGKAGAFNFTEQFAAFRRRSCANHSAKDGHRARTVAVSLAL